MLDIVGELSLINKKVVTNMKCPKCKSKMVKVDLRFSSFVGCYRYAYYCPECDKTKVNKKVM